MFNHIKIKIIKNSHLLFLVLFMCNCTEKQPTNDYKPDATYVAMMADVIFANKVYSKTKYSERDSTMVSLMHMIERINGKDKNAFDNYITEIQDNPDHYQEFLDSVEVKLNAIFIQVEAQIDSSRNNVPIDTMQLSKAK